MVTAEVRSWGISFKKREGYPERVVFVRAQPSPGQEVRQEGRGPSGPDSGRAAPADVPDMIVTGRYGAGMRVYVPATLLMLQTLVDVGELVPVSGTAFALTPMLRESYAAGDTEELEYAAMSEAARASLRLLSAELDDDPKVMPRRVVVAADIDQVKLRPDLDDAAVTVSGPIPVTAVAAVHVDLEEAEPAVRAAAAVVDAADLGDSDAEFILGDAEDHAMAWYAPQELPFLLELL